MTTSAESVLDRLSLEKTRALDSLIVCLISLKCLCDGLELSAVRCRNSFYGSLEAAVVYRDDARCCGLSSIVLSVCLSAIEVKTVYIWPT